MYKCSLKTLIDTPEQHTFSELNKETKAVYISEPGLYQLVFSSRLKLAGLMHCSVLHGNFREEEKWFRGRGVCSALEYDTKTS